MSGREYRMNSVADVSGVLSYTDENAQNYIADDTGEPHPKIPAQD